MWPGHLCHGGSLTATGGESQLVAITARGLGDYTRMFCLDENSLRENSFLDCASGASTFGAQLRLRGGSVISAAPTYRDGALAIRNRVEHNLAGAPAWLKQNSRSTNCDYLGSIDAYIRCSELGLDLFTHDLRSHPEHYLAAALPCLSLPPGR